MYCCGWTGGWSPSMAFRRIDATATPDEFMPVELTLSAVGHAFQPGHRVQLSVTSSLFPLYDRNAMGARQEIASGGEFSSRLTLPVSRLAADALRKAPDF